MTIKVKFIILCMVFFSCSNNSVQDLKQSKTMAVELSIYPTGGGEQGYLILVNNDTITTYVISIDISNNENVFTNLIKEKSRKLTDSEITKLQDQVDYILSIKEDVINYYPGEDTWSFELKVNGKDVSNFERYLPKNQPSNILIEILIKISPIKLDIEGFS